MQYSESNIDSGGQYLGFTIGGEEYGVDILRVREIREWQQIRPLPDTPEYIKGVLDLRGTIVPVIDLRSRFNLVDVEYGPTTVIIVLSVEAIHGQTLFGIVVDAVSEVLDIPSTAIRAAPDLGAVINTRYMIGMATLNERMVILLNIDKMLSADELGELQKA